MDVPSDEAFAALLRALQNGDVQSDQVSYQKLIEAAQYGDVNFLKEAVVTQQPDFFLPGDTENTNLINAAVTWDQEEFLREALKTLPRETINTLLGQPDKLCGGFNSFHVAAARGNHWLMKLLLDYAYASWLESSPPSSSTQDSRPWLAEALGGEGGTPLHVALLFEKEECALEILNVEGSEVLYSMDDKSGASPLLYAISRGCAQVALKILQSQSYSTSGKNGESPLHLAPFCSEEVCKLLLQKHPEMLTNINEDGRTFLHRWVMIGKLWPFQLLVNKVENSAWRRKFIDLMCLTDNTGNNALHVACRNTNEETVEIVKLLLETYMSAYEKEKDEFVRTSPLKKENILGLTPLNLTLLAHNETLALYYLSVDFENSIMYGSKSALFFAVRYGCDQVVRKILTSVDQPLFGLVKYKGGNGDHVLHVASQCQEETASLLVDKFPTLINEPDEDAKKPLDIAAEEGSAWLVKLLLKKDLSSMTKAPKAWIKACEKGHVSTVEAFMNHCQNFRGLCLEKKDTPLHHIELQDFQEYHNFLSLPLLNDMKNACDKDGATPLHRAIERDDILYAEVLLSTEGVDTTIVNAYGKTAMQLLAEKCTQPNWNAMCQRVNINPRLRTTYVQNTASGSGSGGAQGNGTSSIGEMRATLSVVSALLATLTFAAGFTLPGGFNSDTGRAIMPAKAAFIIFLLADTYAMCCSMLVLFCLIWSMVSDRNTSVILVDSSIKVLKQSLYGTLVAFMTGIFTVISDKSLWTAIVVIIMCCFVGVAANRTILFKVVDNLLSSANNRRLNQDGLNEQGNLPASGGANSQKIVAPDSIV